MKSQNAVIPIQKRIGIVAMASFIVLLTTIAEAQAGSKLFKNYKMLVGTVLSIMFLVALFVTIVMIYFLYKYREGSAEERPKIKNEKKFEIAWTLLASLIVFGIFVVSVPAFLDATDSPSPNQEYTIVNIVGYQFGWDFTVEGQNTTTGYVNLQVNTLYLLNITSNDVIHSFFSYDLGFKVDAVPGQSNYFWLEILEPGNYLIQCAEFCGKYHYAMSAYIYAS